METNVKGNYKKNVAGDGTITYRFNQAPVSLSMLFPATLGILFVACIPAGIGLAIIGGGGDAAGFIFFVLWMLSIFGIIALWRKPGVIVVKPEVGIIAGKRNIAFKDISRLTIEYDNNGVMGQSSAKVRAEVRGAAVPVTQTVKAPLAVALVHELQSVSGQQWGDLR